MSLTPLVTVAATESGSGINPWLVGGGIFLLLLVLLGGLMAFGGGRDHS
jgi:hypothetical protein